MKTNKPVRFPCRMVLRDGKYVFDRYLTPDEDVPATTFHAPPVTVQMLTNAVQQAESMRSLFESL